jgi:hypothetical protein
VRAAVEALARRDQPPRGVLISIDELHDVPTNQLKEVTNDIQLLLRSGYRVGLVAAGLPTIGLDDPATMPTFVARSWRPALTLSDDHEIRTTFVATLKRADRQIDPTALTGVTTAAGGLPYAMQLIGWHLIDRQPDTPVITADQVTNVLPIVHTALVDALYGTYQEPSKGAKQFLTAMTLQGDTADYSRICQHLGRTSTQLTTVRARLINAGYITPADRGQLRFTHLALRAIVSTHPDIHAALTKSTRHAPRA